jgi:hypothetical protein
MNPYDDHDLTLWMVKAGLTSEEARRAVREGLDSGRIPWQSANETDAQVRDRINAVQDYLKDQYLAGYDDYLKQISAMNAQRSGLQSGTAHGPLAVAPAFL